MKGLYEGKSLYVPYTPEQQSLAVNLSLFLKITLIKTYIDSFVFHCTFVDITKTKDSYFTFHWCKTPFIICVKLVSGRTKYLSQKYSMGYYQ